MATKLGFWDDHNSDFPADYIYCDGTEKFIMAVYALNDSAYEDSDECDYGVFHCGFGDRTLNDGNERFNMPEAKKAYGPSWRTEKRTNKKGKIVNPKAYKVSNGVTMYKYVSPLRYPDKLMWIIHKEEDGSTWLYKPQLVEKEECSSYYSRGTKAFDVTGWNYIQIMENCNKDGFTYKEVNDREKAASERSTRVIGERMMSTNNIAVQFDGVHIVVLLAQRPKSTMRELTQLIEGEGGFVDEQGIIRRGTAENKIYNPYA